MSYSRRRTDANHVRLGKIARQIDPGALDCHAFGAIGCDFLARNIRTGRPTFLEVKDPAQPPSARQLTDNEVAMQARYPSDYFVCLTEDDVRRALGLNVPSETAGK